MLNETLARLAFTLAAIGMTFTPSFGIETDDSLWRLEYQTPNDEILAGSPLDFAELVPGEPAGTKGVLGVSQNGVQVAFPGDQDAQRFNCASAIFTPPVGGYPSHDESEFIAEQLHRRGYNLARLHFVDAMLMNGSTSDFTYDAVQQDRLYYLLASLKKKGIYWIVDGLTSDNGAYGDVRPHRWAPGHSLKGEVYYKAEAQKHWKMLVTSILNKRNPYTGLSTLHDPALIVVSLVNEGGINQLVKAQKDRIYNEWASSYAKGIDIPVQFPVSIGALNDAAQHRGIGIPPPRQMEAYHHYIIELQRKTARWMSKYLRDQGYKGLISAYNSDDSLGAGLARSELDVVDMHYYFNWELNDGRPSFVPKNVIKSGWYSIDNLRWTPLKGKPFLMTEYGEPYPSPYRHEISPIIAYFASKNDWFAICKFAEGIPIVYDTYFRGSRTKQLFPFGLANDPVDRAGEVLSTLMFMRRDIGLASRRITLHVPVQNVLLKYFSQYGHDISPIADTDAMTSVNYTDSDDNADCASRACVKAEDNARYSGSKFGILKKGSDALTISSPKTIVVVGGKGARVAGRGVTAEILSGRAALSVSSLPPVKSEKCPRFLVIFNTDAKDRPKVAETTLSKGRFRTAALIKTGRFSLRLAHKDECSFEMFSLSRVGARVDKIPVTSHEGETSVDLDTSRLRGGTMYFELVS